jgi:hypothetical protein
MSRIQVRFYEKTHTMRFHLHIQFLPSILIHLKTNRRLLEKSKLSKIDYGAVEVVEVAGEVEQSSLTPKTMPPNRSKAF